MRARWASAVLNTLRVSLLGIVIATALGLLIGVARLSDIWIVSTLASVYVEVLRNTPLLLQLLFWYRCRRRCPDPRAGAESPAGRLPVLPRLFCRLAWHDGSIALERPALAGFDFHGGISISPEFAALLIGLSTCTAAFIGEIVRGGVLAVDKGQTEAAAALGFSRSQSLRLVVLPQALRVIVPPTTSQFLNLVEELVAGRGHRLPRSDLDHQHDAESDRPGDRSDRARDDRLPGDQPGHLAGHEPYDGAVVAAAGATA